MMKFKRGILFLTLSVLVVSCGLSVSSFRVVDSAQSVKPGKVAVIAATEHKAALYLAFKMTQEFEKQGTFSVMTQKQVSQRLPGYPFKVKGPFRETYTKTVDDFSSTDTKAVAAIARKLGVEYLYIFWTPTLTRYNDTVNIVRAYHQLFAFPGGRQIGNGNFDIQWMKEGSLYIGSAPESFPEAADFWSKRVVEEVCKKTGMSRKKKG